MLEIKNFSKSYGEKKVVDSLSISVQPGDIYGFIGANGAGKTTTIKAVVGIHDFEDGSITINGHSIKEEPVICKKMMAYIPDNPDLYELGFMQKITFGSKDLYKDTISISRYGFAFGSFGFISFNPNTSHKFLFAEPFYWEVGGGAGFNINVSRHSSIVLEFGGGLHDIINGSKLGYPRKLNMIGFGRISIGTRYYF